jgi:S1-C subfamily serine protease
MAIGFYSRSPLVEVAAETLPIAPLASPATLPAAAPPTPTPAAEPLPSPREVARRALAYTVFVRSGGAYGAGVVLDAAGHVLTCQHVVEGNATARISFVGSEAAQTARVVDRDRKLDLALLKLAAPLPASVEPASVAGVGSVAGIEMGDEVFAMGAPRKLSFSLSRGIVSYAGRAFDGGYYLQTDIATNPGSSGGPVLDSRGDLVAIASFIYRDSDGLAFALPVDYAYRRFARALGGAASGDKQDLESRLQSFEAWLAARGTTNSVQKKNAAATGRSLGPEAAAAPDTRGTRGSL